MVTDMGMGTTPQPAKPITITDMATTTGITPSQFVMPMPARRRHENFPRHQTYRT